MRIIPNIYVARCHLKSICVEPGLFLCTAASGLFSSFTKRGCLDREKLHINVQSGVGRNLSNLPLSICLLLNRVVRLLISQEAGCEDDGKVPH